MIGGVGAVTGAFPVRDLELGRIANSVNDLKGLMVLDLLSNAQVAGSVPISLLVAAMITENFRSPAAQLARAGGPSIMVAAYQQVRAVGAHSRANRKASCPTISCWEPSMQSSGNKERSPLDSPVENGNTRETQ
ncbi:hypothetical protein [Paractinoplanes tereljensis]|uniref:hypothetical protein n=1 Tax=Paractinoplanes tereljensis TaxID=571912 RepID=UPI003396C21B